MYHVDLGRDRDVTWLCYKGADGKRVYMYESQDPAAFLIKLGELLK